MIITMKNSQPYKYLCIGVGRQCRECRELNVDNQNPNQNPNQTKEWL